MSIDPFLGSIAIGGIIGSLICITGIGFFGLLISVQNGKFCYYNKKYV
jgi:hypothetical protein